MKKIICLAAGLTGLALLPAQAQTAACAVAGPNPVTHITLPGRPTGLVVTPSGCSIFLAIAGAKRGANGQIAVVARANGSASLIRSVPFDGDGGGVALSPDGAMLLASNGQGLTFFSSRALLTGTGNVMLGRLPDNLNKNTASGAAQVTVSPDGKLVFISDRTAKDISVFDLAKIRAGNADGAQAIGRIRTDNRPAALTFSPDGKTLYVTSEVDERFGECPGFNAADLAETGGKGGRPKQGEGTLIAVDVAKAAVDPANAATPHVKAGCAPVRVAAAPKGDRLYVTARNENAIKVIDTAKLSGAGAVVATIPAGTAPGGVVLAGNRLYVAADGGENNVGSALVVIDTDKQSVVATVPLSGGAREIRLTPDGGTLLVTNGTSLNLVDLKRLDQIK